MKKPSTALFLLSFFFLASSYSGFAQDILPKGGKSPAMDGVAEPQEYSLAKTVSGMRLGFSLSQDGKTLYASINAPTGGWVAVGLGSRRMDRADIFMGYESGGKPFFTTQNGSGHSHSDKAADKSLSYAVKSSKGETTLEISLPAEGYFQNGQLLAICAYGRGADFRSPHMAFSSINLKLAQ